MTARPLESDRVPVIAVGLVEWDRRTGRPARDNRLHYDGAVYLPGQETQIRARDTRRLVRARQVQVVADLPRIDWWRDFGTVLQCEPGDAMPRLAAPLAESLRIAHGTSYDPGNAGYRFDAALNEYSPHRAIFIRYLRRGNNPFSCPSAIDATTQPDLARAVLLTADVVHCHMDHYLTQGAGLSRRPRPGQLRVKHYHGTQFNGKGEQERDEDQMPRRLAVADDLDFQVLVGARLTICALRPGRIQWLPIAVPVDRYSAMATPRPAWDRRPFRIAHSPTNHRIKGTHEFLRACRRLSRRGLSIEPVLIQRQSHAAALRLRATAHACFDSFALGIQGSGLEAAAMGQPVIAGDAAVADLYRAHTGAVPYTFADTGPDLERTIERLATDPRFYAGEALRAGLYCRRYHDYPAVATRYSQILADAGARPLA